MFFQLTLNLIEKFTLAFRIRRDVADLDSIDPNRSLIYAIAFSLQNFPND
jgi:hypothetical protein